jgi:hypothetical protein
VKQEKREHSKRYVNTIQYHARSNTPRGQWTLASRLSATCKTATLFIELIDSQSNDLFCHAFCFQAEASQKKEQNWFIFNG